MKLGGRSVWFKHETAGGTIFYPHLWLALVPPKLSNEMWVCGFGLWKQTIRSFPHPAQN